MAEFVYPARNLPEMAEVWGRAVEARDLVKSKEITQLAQSLNNSQRATGGQLAVISEQLDAVVLQQAEIVQTVSELSARSSHSTTPAALTLILGSGAGEVGPSARTATLPPPVGGRRNAIIVGSGSVAWTGTTTGSGIADSVTVGLEFRQDGSRVWYDNSSASSAQQFAFMGSDTFSLSIPVRVPASGSTFDLRMWVGSTSSGGQVNRGARLENMTFSIIYGDKY